MSQIIRTRLLSIVDTMENANTILLQLLTGNTESNATEFLASYSKINNSDDIYIIKNIIDYIVKINKKEFLNCIDRATLLVKDDAAGMIDEAASLVHGMNLNVFTGASFHLTDVANKQAFADAMKNNILNNQWMCGSPDQYVIYSVYDEYVVVAFGAVDVMNVFKANFAAVHGDAVEVLYEENVAQ